VRSQSTSAVHFFVGDGPDAPALQFKGIRWHRLDEPANDFGETPRRFAARIAVAEGFDAISFLDADNWWLSNHLDSLVKLHLESDAEVCTSRRSVHHIDGTLLGYCRSSDGVRFSDTNCTVLFKSAIRWAFFSETVPSELKPIHDRILWAAIRASAVRTAHSGLYTAAYRTKFRSHYELSGTSPPDGVYQSTAAIQEALRIWQEHGNMSLSFQHEIASKPV